MRETEGVILGMPGPWAEDNHEAADHYTTKIGGVPDWPTPDIAPDLINCRLCSERLYLVAQVYAPISSHGCILEDRTLYVLACPRPNCASRSDGWRTLRVQRESGSQTSVRTEEKKVPDEQLTSTSSCSDSWWVSGNASDDEIDLMKLSEAISEASRLAQHAKKHNEIVFLEVAPKIKPRHNSSHIPVLPCFYLFTEEEKFFDEKNNIQKQYSSLSIKESSTLSADSPDEERWEAESYEYDRAPGADRIYLKFKKRVEAYPQQCIRYFHEGRPLVAAELLEEPISCKNCGAKSCFEMQLMPPLMFFLQQAADDKLTPCSLRDWSWMTIMVYTCSKNCFRQSSEDQSTRGDGWTVAEESIVIQWE